MATAVVAISLEIHESIARFHLRLLLIRRPLKVLLISDIQQISLRKPLINLQVFLFPTMLRHACGFALADQGADTRLIQDYLGTTASGIPCSTPPPTRPGSGNCGDRHFKPTPLFFHQLKANTTNAAGSCDDHFFSRIIYFFLYTMQHVAYYMLHTINLTAIL